MTFSITATPAIVPGPNGESPASVIVDIATTEVITRITRTDSYGIYDLIPDKATVIAGNYPGLGANVVKRTNRVLNPSFETNVTSWAPTFAAGTLATYAATSGTWAGGRVGSNLGMATSNETSRYVGIKSSTMAVTAGAWIVAKAWVCNDSSITGGSRLKLVFNSSEQITPWIVSPFYAGQFCSIITQVPSNGTTAYIEAQMDTGSAALMPTGKRLWLDQVRLESFGTEAEAVQAAALPYFDGATPAAGLIKHRWTGTAHGSTSEQYFSGWRVTDDAAPFETVTYTAYTAGGTQSVTVNNDRPEMPVMLTTLTGGAAWIIAEQITTYNGRRDSGAIHHDTGGEFPVVTYGTRKLRTGTLGIYCPSHADALKVEAVLTDHVALIRQHVPGLDLAISVLSTEVSPHEGQSERTRWNVNAEFAEVKYSPVWSLI